jgi:hypothetical protein
MQDVRSSSRKRRKRLKLKKIKEHHKNKESD